MIRVFESLRVSSERKLEIVREIKDGSQPSMSFYIVGKCFSNFKANGEFWWRSQEQAP